MLARRLLASTAALVALAAPATARAVGVGGPAEPPVVAEEYVFVVDDPGRGLVHLLYAARIETASISVSLGMPVPSRPEVASVPELDLARAAYTLIASYEAALSGAPPAPPAPWDPRGVSIDTGAIAAADAGAPSAAFDAEWLRSLAARASWLGVLTAQIPPGRIEATTPAARLTFASDHPRLVLCEPPPRAREGAAGAGALTVQRATTEPAKIAPSEETLAKILRAHVTDELACADGPDRPQGPVVIELEGAVDRHGNTTSFAATTPGALAACVAKAARKKALPRMDAPWTFKVLLLLTPPALPPRRTHVFVLTRERIELTRRPARLTPVRELEPRTTDVATAFDGATRAALGIEPGARLWLTEYLDRSPVRGEAADLDWARVGPPAEGAPGTLAYASAKERARSGVELAPEPRTGPRGWKRRVRRALLIAALAAFALGLAAFVHRAARA